MDMDVGSIEKVPIREVWKREDVDFTPWLSKNLYELEKKLDIGKITNITSEENIGDFRCDITGNIGNKRIIIENMYDKSDHDHLGKCITYASMLKADYVIFIAEYFRKEHLTAIGWLNEQFGLDSCMFFAVEISAIKIGESKPAPLFTVVKEPDMKRKEVELERSSTEISERVSNRQKFWSDFINVYGQIDSSWKDRTPTKESWMSKGIGKSGINIIASFREFPTISLYIQTKSKEENQKTFTKIKEKYREQIENELNSEGQIVVWKSPEDGNMQEKRQYREIYISADFKIDFKNSSESENEKCRNWFVKNMTKFNETFTTIINEIK
jgi:hypothetical protein